MQPLQKITPFLWFDTQAEEAAKFYTSIFENSRIDGITRYDEASAEAAGRPVGSVLTVAFELDGQPGHKGVAWSDAGGGHRVISGAAEQASQLPERTADNADVLWRVERTAGDSHDALIVLMPAFPPGFPGDAQARANPPEESGKMILWTGTSGRWTQLRVEEPRRG